LNILSLLVVEQGDFTGLVVLVDLEQALDLQ
jgi:hypothetical protein